MTWKDKLLIFLAGIGAALAGVVAFMSKKKNNSNLVKDYYDEKRKNFDLENASTAKRIMDVPIVGLLKDGEYIQEAKPESED